MNRIESWLLRIPPRRLYSSFFWLTGVSLIVIGVLSWSNRTLDSIWPGGAWWAVLYVLAGLASFAAGVTARKFVRTGRWLWLRRFGLLGAPFLLIVRAIANVEANGVDGLLGSVFLMWAALVPVWATLLLRFLPTDPDEWHALRARYEELRHRVDGE